MGCTCDIAVRFHEPPEDLARFFTTFYRVEFTCPDGPVRDALHPEWAGIRIFSGDLPKTTIAGGGKVEDADFTAMGPTSKPVAFELGTSRMWGMGLLPIGWATFMDAPADEFANRIFDGRAEPAFGRFLPLADSLTAAPEAEEEELERIIRFFREEIVRHEPKDPRILAIHQVLMDPSLPDVAGMAECTGINPRTLERICHRAFGFGPKKLLRRQRFMRSLAQFMLDPELSWIGAIDSLYFDQSHFVRDCREFLGMSPSEYAAQDHPVLSAFMQERLKAHGSAVQTLDSPD